MEVFNIYNYPIDDALIRALGWTLIHSIWQVSLMALIVHGINTWLGKSSSIVRYYTSLVSLIFSFIISVWTFAYYMQEPSMGTTDSSIIDSQATTIDSDIITSHTMIDTLQFYADQYMGAIILVWILGLLLFLSKFLISYSYVRYLKRTAMDSIPPAVCNQVNLLCKTLDITKRVYIYESAKIAVPMVINHLKPIILFPIGMVNLLEPAEIEAILLHELAHIRRNDYIVNMIVHIMEAVYFFHPAMWWISANIRIERENCCDEIAIATQGDQISYAKILVKLEEWKQANNPSLAMSFTSKPLLINRIKRILNMKESKNEFREKTIATLLLSFMIFVLVTQVENVTAQQLQKMINADENITVKVEDGKLVKVTVDGASSKDDRKGALSSIINSSNGHTSYEVVINGNPSVQYDDEKISFFGDDVVIHIDDEMMTDTLPKRSQSSVKIISDTDGKKIEIQRENGKITELKVNGETVPESEYDEFEDEINEVEGGVKIFRLGEGDDEHHFEFKWDGDGMEDGIFDDSVFVFKMQKMGEGFENLFKGLDQFQDIEILRMDQLQEMMDVEEMQMRSKELLEKRMPELRERMEELKLKLGDGSDFKMFFRDLGDNDVFQWNFDSEDFDFPQWDGHPGGQGNLSDVIGRNLQKDGLLEEYKNNKVELSGKHLKINGDKMPKALYEKYKDIYQAETGTALTKDSKIVFEIEGKPSKRKLRTF